MQRFVHEYRHYGESALACLDGARGQSNRHEAPALADTASGGRSDYSVGNAGTQSCLAENFLLKRQLLVLRRARRRAPNLRTADRLLFGFYSQFLSTRRLARAAIILEPATLLRFHRGSRNGNTDSSTPHVRKESPVQKDPHRSCSKPSATSSGAIPGLAARRSLSTWPRPLASK